MDQSKKKYKYDFFISHASNNKLKTAQAFYDAFTRLGIHCFYDKHSICCGENWVEKIKDSMKESRYAVFIITKSFLKNLWTSYELEVFLKYQRENETKIVLPYAYNVSVEEIIKKYPTLSNIQITQFKNTDINGIVANLAASLEEN